ncbi:MAG TPA: hypothetical protein VGM54_08190 [Chthoniobacter sp.]
MNLQFFLSLLVPLFWLFLPFFLGVALFVFFLGSILSRRVWILGLLALTLACQCWNLSDVFIQGHFYFVDGDCYSRMTRAQMIAEHPGTMIRRHEFENWPQGVTAHTTAPLDYLIVFLKVLLDGAFRLFDPAHRSLLHSQTLDLAGALVSPLLGMAGAIFLAWWLTHFRVPYGSAALFIYAVSPIVAHGYLLARPDHQSLLMMLITVALGAELALAQGPSAALSPAGQRNWGIVSALAWSTSLWVSLYEPTILLVVVFLLWLCFRPRALFTRTRLPGAVIFLAVLLLALALEGWSVELPNAEMRAYFGNWEKTIGELSHAPAKVIFQWIGWMAVATPVLLLLAWRRDRRALPLLILLGVVLLLTVWQERWGYFLAIVFAWTLPWQMQALQALLDSLVKRFVPGTPRAVQAILRWSVTWMPFVICLWPILKDWDSRLFPDDFTQDRQTVNRGEMVALRGLAVEAIGANGGPFLASWWLSPAIAYWSRQPGVAGTSHESLPGIVDTAHFYLSANPSDAATILMRRPVHWVLAGDPQQEISTSSILLGVAPPKMPMATILYDHPENAPDYLREWNGKVTAPIAGVRFYRLYEVIDANLPK